MRHDIVAALLIAAVSVYPATTRAADWNATDKTFVMKAATSGAEEVSEGKAYSTASNTDARVFAARMVQDHTKANAQLAQIANSVGLSSALQQGLQEAKAPSAASPSVYLKKEVTDHQEAIALFEDEAKNGANPSLRQFAQQSLPTLREHLAMAEKYS